MQTFDPLEKCPDAGGMVHYLHGLMESDRSTLARQLHDELGGLMVAVVMDLAFAEQNLLHGCERSKIACTDAYPDLEPPFMKEAAIGLFRIAQATLGIVQVHPTASAAHVAVDVTADSFHMAVSCNGETREARKLAARDTHAVCAIAHRVKSFGGRLVVANLETGGAMYRAEFPLAPLTGA